MIIGAQLYTLRDHTKTLDDFAETLKKVADIGYTTVQVSATCDFEPQWLKEQLDKTGLKCVLTHAKAENMLADPDKVVADHAVFGCKYIGLGSMPGIFSEKGLTQEGYDDFCAKFKPVAQRFAQFGALLMYHNHNKEFGKSDDGRIYMKRMADDFKQSELGFTLDTYWVQAGGADPAQWLRDLKGRVPCVHLKDMIFADGGQHMAPIFEGNMNFDAILAACEAAGTEYMLVEQDNCYGADPFDCLKTSYKNLTAHGLK